MPIKAGQKNTLLAHQAWLDALSAKKITDRWSANPFDDIALQCGNGVVVLDADSPESLYAMLALEEKHRVVPAMVVNTKKGVHHYFRQSPDLRVKAAGHSTENHPERIDVRCGNAYIITAPSTDKILATDEVVPFSELTYLTQAFVDDLDVHNGKQPETKTQRFSVEPQETKAEREDQELAFLRALVDELDPDEGYDPWVQTLMALYYETKGSDDGLTLADEWSSRGPSYKGFKEVAYKWNSFGKYDGPPKTIGSLYHAVEKAGGDPVAIKAKVQEQYEPFALTETIKVAIPFKTSKHRAHPSVIQPLDSESFPHHRLRKNSSLPGILPKFGPKPLDLITHEDLTLAHQQLKASGYATVSANKIVVTVKTMFNLAKKLGVPGSQVNPAAGIDLFDVQNARERYLSKEETQRLLQAIEGSENLQLKFIVPLLLLTGARKREILDATWDEVSTVHKTLRVPLSKSGKPRLIFTNSK